MRSLMRRLPGRPGAVYAMTNAVGGNEVVIYGRAADGALTLRGKATTGGYGSGGQLTQSIDPLGSQGALVMAHNGRRLFAVNAGSDEVSVLKVRRRGGLKLLACIGSGGGFPVSLALHRDLLYVLNSGGDGTLAGFQVRRDGCLQPIPGSRRSLGASGKQPPNVFESPAQVRFTPRGDRLVVTHKASNGIHVFAVESDGLLAHRPVTSTSAGNAPFGFTFDRRGHLLMVEVFGSGEPEGEAVSSYELTEDGTARVISASVGNRQRATCWIAGSRRPYAYTTNTASGTLSAYRVSPDGSLELLGDGTAAAFEDPNALPIDTALTPDGRFLYTLNAGTGTVAVFRARRDGRLAPLGEANGLPAADGAQGLAAW